MSAASVVVFDPRTLEYNFGPGHPLAPVRVDLAMALARSLGALNGATVLDTVDAASEQDLARVHTPGFIDAVREASREPQRADVRYGIGTSDTPAFTGMHDAAARVAGATLVAARAAATMNVHAVNLAGGLHHAMAAQASGFCVYNDIAVAIAALLDDGFTRIAYLDLDVHHGDGVQSIFWNDPRVLTISIHESPRTLFPHTGDPTETGGPLAPGTAVNIALPSGTGDQGWLRALHAVVPDLLAVFQPEILITQHGADAHRDDPLAHLRLTVDGQRLGHVAARTWADLYAGGRWVAVGGGGYALVSVVPRSWAHLVGEVTGNPIAPATMVPLHYREDAAARTGEISPDVMTDGADPWPRPLAQGFHPDDPVDAAIMATREAVFGVWGLDSEPDVWF